MEGGNIDDISYRGLLKIQAMGKDNAASQQSFLKPYPASFTIQKINVTGDIYMPSHYKLFDANHDYYSLNSDQYVLRISYSEPFFLSQIAPYKLNIAILFYCDNTNTLIYRAMMDIFEKLTEVELLRIKDIWKAFDIEVDNDYLKWYIFRIDMKEIWPRISYQCHNDHHIACVSQLDYNVFGTDDTSMRYSLNDMDATICNELCQYYQHYAVSGSTCFCDNGESSNITINPDHLTPNSFCNNCPDYTDADFCGDELRSLWNIYAVNLINIPFPSSFTMTQITHNSDKGEFIKRPYGYLWKSIQQINAADIDCWKFEWDEYIAYTFHYKPLGVSDTKIGEKLALYHKDTGVLIRIMPLGFTNDDQVASITISSTTAIDIQYTTANTVTLKYSELFHIPSAYANSISENYLGCYMDREIGGDMMLKVKESGVMTFEACNSECALKSFRFMGLRYNLVTQSQECWCGLKYGSYGALVLNSCNYYCKISPEYRCGSTISKYHSQKILSVYSTTTTFNSRSLLFEGNWKDSATQNMHQICQWNNDYIIESNTASTKISTINMLHIPKLHQCGNNDAQYTEDLQSLTPSYQLTWNENNAKWTREKYYKR